MGQPRYFAARRLLMNDAGPGSTHERGLGRTNAACAAVLLPIAMASSTRRNDDRIRERRALLIWVRRAILRVAFLADLVLAIRVSLKPWVAMWLRAHQRHRKSQRRHTAAEGWKGL